MLKALAQGMGTTLRIFFRKKKTIAYPKEKKPRAERFRGRHELRRYDNGLEMCIGCELCQVACPAAAITVMPAENDPNRPNSPGERYAWKYEIDMLRCIFCGLCEEACPTQALHLTPVNELADFTRGQLDLLAAAVGKHAHQRFHRADQRVPGVQRLDAHAPRRGRL